MAVEIIKRGKLPEDLVYTGDCYHCGTQMRAKKSDLEYDGEYHHNCELCHNRVRFHKEPE